jgi:cytochrome P450
MDADGLSPLDVDALPSLRDLGFTGGRNGFHAFCARAFAPDAPRFLRSDEGHLVVFRHEDLRAFGAMASVGNVPPAILFPTLSKAWTGQSSPGAAFAGVIANQAFTTNPPIHGPLRRILLDQFGPRPVAGMESLARKTALGIVEDLPFDGEADLVADVAEKLTSRFFGAVLGMTAEEISLTASAISAMTPFLRSERHDEDLADADRAAAAYRALVERATLRSLARGGHPILEAMAADLARLAFPDDPVFAGVVPRTLGAYLAGNLFDAFHTAALAATNTLEILLRHPEAFDAVRRAPDLAAAAVAEALRLEPPVIFLKRWLLDDVVYGGATIPRARAVVMLWAAGNHDPAAFPDPERFDLARPRQGLTTFGGGGHICPGRHVAGMLARVMLETLLERDVELARIDGPDSWIEGHMMSQLRALPVRVRRGPGRAPRGDDLPR